MLLMSSHACVVPDLRITAKPRKAALGAWPYAQIASLAIGCRRQ